MADKSGYIDVTVRLYLGCDVTEDNAKEIVEEMDYSFSHPIISDTLIMDYVPSAKVQDQEH